MLFVTAAKVYSSEITWQELKLIANNVKISFSMFPTQNAWNGKNSHPVLDTKIKIDYRTILTDASKKEPNFDGKYRIVEFGFGSSTQNFFIIDLNNGNVYEGRASSFGIKYSVNSSLIIINPIENMDWGADNEKIPSWVFIEYVKWTNQEYTGLVALNKPVDE